jgi:hypothetical protein
MALKIWLIRKIEKIELELKYFKALEIMLSHVEKANDYSDSDSDSDSDYSLNTNDIKALDDSDDETKEETLLREALERIIEFKKKYKE